jgi:hypothetical protein
MSIRKHTQSRTRRPRGLMALAAVTIAGPGGRNRRGHPDAGEERGEAGLRGVAGALLGSLLAGSALVLLQASPAAARPVERHPNIYFPRPAVITEGASGTRMLTFYVGEYHGPSGTCLGTVGYWTSPDKPGGLVAPATTLATPGVDYVHVEGTINLGCAVGEVSVPIIGDTLSENNETFRLYVVNEATFTVGTIVDDDDVTTAVRIGDASVTEGHTGTTTPATFTITRSGPKTSASSVKWATVDNRVAQYAATAGLDYQPSSGTATFAPGADTATVTVPVIGDLKTEVSAESLLFTPGEEFHVLLSSPTGTIILDGTGLGTIADDDPLQGVGVGAASVTEGNAGTKEMKFTITRYGENNFVQVVDWRTGGSATATAGTDFQSANGTVQFGVAETSKTFSVLVIGDTTVEADETIGVTITTTAPGKLIKDGDRAVGTIVNDDTGISIDNVTVVEGNSGTKLATFTLTRVGPTGYSSVTWDTDNGTALAGSDYVSDGNIVYFAPGDTKKQLTVTVLGETVPELDETFVVRLSDPVGASITKATGTLTITDDDSVLTVNDVSVTEGNSGTTPATFTITRTGPTTNSASVGWYADKGTVLGSTSAAQDFKAASGTATFAAGSSTTTVSIAVVGDTYAEPNEQFQLKLSMPVGINTIADGIGVCTILNDD